MKTLKLLNYERDRWVAGDGALEIPSAIDGAPVATTGSDGLDFAGMLDHARNVGGPALRKLTFHERALSTSVITMWLAPWRRASRNVGRFGLCPPSSVCLRPHTGTAA